MKKRFSEEQIAGILREGEAEMKWHPCYIRAGDATNENYLVTRKIPRKIMAAPIPCTQVIFSSRKK